MKKIIFLVMLAISSVALTSCVSNDDEFVEDVINVGNVNYLGQSLPLRYAIISDIKQADNGYYYEVELSTNPIPTNGRLNGAYLYLKIFQRGDLNFNGNYITGNDNRGLDYIEYFENPIMENGIPAEGSGSLELYDNQISSGNIFMNNYTDVYGRDLLNTNFTITDVSGNRMTGDFDGWFDFNKLYAKSVMKVSAKRTETQRDRSKNLSRKEVRNK